MSPISVADSLSNREEHIVELARTIGKGHKRSVFEEVYRGQKQTKTVAEISQATGLSEIQVLKAGVALVAAHAISQISVRGRVAYSKIPSHKAIKDRVLKIAGDRKKVDAIPTKRFMNKSVVVQVISGKPPEKTRTARPKSGVCRIAFLLASPVGVNGINVGMDYREAADAVQKATNRSRFDLRPFPAAHAGTLLDALNEFKPDIIQFSGHGGQQSILVDTAEIITSGGLVLDYALFREMLSTAEKAPKLLILAACQSLDGSEQFLDVVPLVISMSDKISDWAGAYFSRRFFAAIASGASVDTSFRQAKSILAAENLPEAHLPTLLSARGVDPTEVRFS
ncbi:hypothetical protein [Sphingopyxis sp.]|uniref:hypothetical protein n=1 Tax=Sphingopyxis sp. TaxID=1908224 RepID=UPI00311D6B58